MSQGEQRGRGQEGIGSRPFRTRSTSYATITLLTIGMALLMISVLCMLAERFATMPEMLSEVLRSPAQARSLLLAGLALVLASMVCEAFSRLRTPPPTWRVKQELSKALIDMGLLPRDTARWKGIYWVAPFATYSFKEKKLTLLFNVKHARATEAGFGKVEDAIMSSFSHSQGISIEPATFHGRRECWRLNVWYGSDWLIGPAQKVNPW